MFVLVDAIALERLSHISETYKLDVCS